MVGSPFGVDLCDVIMRLYKRIDDMMRKPEEVEIRRRTRWRHFLPASFAVRFKQYVSFIKSSEKSSIH
jgi:hypothetical protein